MATIAPTAISSGTNVVAQTTLTASDTFAYDPNGRQVLILENGTGGALTVNIDGDGATTVRVGGVGAVDISSGFTTGAIAGGATIAIPLDSIKEYLVGAVVVTGGTGITARLLSF